MVTEVLDGVPQASSMYGYRSIASSSQAPPTTSTYYTVLDTTSDVLLEYLTIIYAKVGGTTANLRWRITIDGSTVTTTSVCNSGSYYYIYFSPVSDSPTWVTTQTPIGVAFPVYGKSVKVEMGYVKAALDDPDTLYAYVRYGAA